MTTRLFRALVVAAFAGPLFAATPPAAQLRGEVLSVTLPAGLLGEREVRRQLHSGLTTSFTVVATLDDDSGRRSGARIDVRFEPWDEVFFVTTRRVGAAPQTQRIGTFAQLETWWRDTALPLFPKAGGARSVQIALEVLPFSVAEQQETQRWLTRSLGEARQPSPTPPEEGEPEVRTSEGSVLDALIGTSIKRRPIVRHRWQVRVTR